MTDVRGAFIADQVLALEPFGVVAFAVVTAQATLVAEVERSEDGASFDVVAGGSPAPSKEVAARLGSLGLSAEAPHRTTATSAADAAVLACRIMDEAYQVAPQAPLNVQHASRRHAVMVERKIAALRQRIGGVLKALLPADAYTVDDDGDFSFPYDTTRVFVGPRAMPDGTAAVLVFAATNVGVKATPELGLFLAEANFGVVFGRFALDSANKVVWFGQNLYGESFTDDELTFLIRMIALTSDAFDERIAERFGGQPFNPPGQGAAPAGATPSKPSYAGYL